MNYMRKHKTRLVRILGTGRPRPHKMKTYSSDSRLERTIDNVRYLSGINLKRRVLTNRNYSREQRQQLLISAKSLLLFAIHTVAYLLNRDIYSDAFRMRSIIKRYRNRRPRIGEFKTCRKHYLPLGAEDLFRDMSNLLTSAVEHSFNPRVISENELVKRIRKLASIAWETHASHRKLLKSSAFRKIHTMLTSVVKRAERQRANDLVTERQCGDPKKCIRLVNTDDQTPVVPSKNYAINVAASNLLCKRLSLKSLGYILPFFMANGLGTIVSSTHNTDNLDIIHSIITMMRSRLKTKIIVVSPPHCTCHVKCYGWGNTDRVIRAHYKTCVADQNSLSICGTCLLSPEAMNTKAQKPKRRLNSFNHEAETCPIDGQSTFEERQLYIAECTTNETGHMIYKYMHAFHASNTVNVCEANSDLKQITGPGFRLYGMCYGGYRKCYMMVKTALPSASIMERSACQEQGVESMTHVGFVDHLSSCITDHVQCRHCIKARGKDTSSVQKRLTLVGQGESLQDDNTCVAMMVSSILENINAILLEHNTDTSRNGKFDIRSHASPYIVRFSPTLATIVAQICDGCKIRISCKHVWEDFTNHLKNIETLDKSAVKKLKLYTILLSVVRCYIPKSIREQTNTD